ncbi:MAG TPA: hypothetical protein VLC12_06055 [Terriglobales bacterium]|nr:hypothetical protein [Terriglobales bacterium]
MAACNRTPQGVACAPLTTVTVVRVSQSSQPRSVVIDNPYRVHALVDFANGRRQGFSARGNALPTPVTSATFFNGSQQLLTLSAGANFLALSCDGWQGVEEANRVQVAEFQRLLSNQP